MAEEGFGFYWGSICFYVDSTDAITLPRRQRVIQALAGLGVDVVVVSAFATVAHVSSSALLVAICWRLAIVGVVDLVIKSLPILHLDGHWTLSDWLDEPELASTAHRAFHDVIRRRLAALPGGWLTMERSACSVASRSPSAGPLSGGRHSRSGDRARHRNGRRTADRSVPGGPGPRRRRAELPGSAARAVGHQRCSEKVVIRC